MNPNTLRAEALEESAQLFEQMIMRDTAPDAERSMVDQAVLAFIGMKAVNFMLMRAAHYRYAADADAERARDEDWANWGG